MLRWLFFLGALLSLNAYAIDEERVIKQMARGNSQEADKIRAIYKQGCDIPSYISQATCALFAYTESDIELNDIYKQVIAQLKDTPAKSLLVKAQKAWVVFRDATCFYETDGYSEFRDFSAIHHGCLTEVTKLRAEQLKKYLACRELGCPGNWE